jgi:hypothetical protein
LTTAIQLSVEENVKKTGENVPKKKMKWMTADIRKKIQEKRIAKKTYQKRPTTDNLLIYKNPRQKQED